MARELKELPSPEERQRIRERAGQVLADAQALQEQLDRVEHRLGWSLQINPERENRWASGERGKGVRRVVWFDS